MRDAFQVFGDDAQTVFLAGELDLETAPQLEEAIAPAIARGGPLVLDLSALTFIDSTGVELLARAVESLGTGCLFLHGASGRVERVLELVDVQALPAMHVLPCDRDPYPTGGGERTRTVMDRFREARATFVAAQRHQRELEASSAALLQQMRAGRERLQRVA